MNQNRCISTTLLYTTSTVQSASEVHLSTFLKEPHDRCYGQLYCPSLRRRPWKASKRHVTSDGLPQHSCMSPESNRGIKDTYGLKPFLIDVRQKVQFDGHDLGHLEPGAAASKGIHLVLVSRRFSSATNCWNLGMLGLTSNKVQHYTRRRCTDRMRHFAKSDAKPTDHELRLKQEVKVTPRSEYHGKRDCEPCSLYPRPNGMDRCSSATTVDHGHQRRGNDFRGQHHPPNRTLNYPSG